MIKHIDDLPDVMPISVLAGYLRLSYVGLKKRIKSGTFPVPHYRMMDRERNIYVFKKKDVLKVFGKHE